jgi:hypothetical protein
METIYTLTRERAFSAADNLRPTPLPRKMKRKDVEELMLRYIDHARDLKDGENLVVEFPDGRVLRFFHTTFPRREGGEWREWAAHLFVLRQSPNRRPTFYEHQAWFYRLPHWGEKYKTDPTGTWSYHVWR